MNTDMIAFEAEMRRLRGSHIFDIAPAIEMYRALLARVEAAEAERDAATIHWQPFDEWLAAPDERLGYWLTAETCHSDLSYSRYITQRYWNGDEWGDLGENETVHYVAPRPTWPTPEATE